MKWYHYIGLAFGLLVLLMPIPIGYEYICYVLALVYV